MASLSPVTVVATPIQANPKVSADLQTTVPQTAQDSQKAAKSIQTDTVTISPQALKMADDKNAAAKETASKADEKEPARLAANDKDDAQKRALQRSAEKAYAAVSVN